MPITTTDKIKISKYLRETPIDYINFNHMNDSLGKKGKINFTEYLEYFTECVIDTFKKNENIYTKQMSKYMYLVASFLEYMHQNEIAINEYTLDKIRSFEDFYEEYLIRTSSEKKQEFYEEYIQAVKDVINELYPNDNKNESVTEYINKIAELEDTIKKIKKELNEITRLYEILQNDYNQKEDKNNSLNEKVISLETDLRSKNKELSELKGIVESLTITIKELETSISNLKDEKNILLPYKEKCEELTSEIETLRKTIGDYVKAKTEEDNLKTKYSELEALIYQKILLERASIDDLLKYITEKGITSDKEEVKNILKIIKSKISIDNSVFSITPTYKIVTPRVLEDGTFSINIPNECKYYDIMLISDFHVKEFNSKVLSAFEILNNYCINNNINLILNLGDFYHGTPGMPVNYANAIKNYNVVEQSINLIPKAEGIYHAILGGNHEINVSNHGFDPIKILTDERDDFINLGYTHSTISLNGVNNVLGVFDIHHPHTFDFPIGLDENGIDTVDLNKYLNNIYKRQGRSRDDSYIDVLGHTHRNQFNYPNSYCYIPSFQEGACHLRIYFDKGNKIKYMVFMPLVLNNKLIKTNEIIYTKTLKK